MPSDIDAEAIDRVLAIRADLVREIANRELELRALHARLAGVDLVLKECGISPAGRGDA